MGANDGFTPKDHNKNKSYEDGINEALSNFTCPPPGTSKYDEFKRKVWPEKEQPLTHHQQAVKEFMVALVNAYESSAVAKEDWIKRAKETDMTVQVILAKAADLYADAFINQIKK